MSKSSNVTSSSSSSSASATSSSNKSTNTLTQHNNTNIQQQQQMPHLITTTEEEFESMENAVNNLLVSKKQIDALNSERISLIRIYESKLAEQNAQINYLNEENCKLKSIINSIKCQNSSPKSACKVEETKTTTTTSKNNQRLALQSFDLCLDNLIRQLLNSLKIQETIRVEYLRQSSTKNNSNSCFDKTNVNQLICTSDSWTFNQQDQQHRKEPLHQKDDHIKSISGSTESSCDGENNSNTSANSTTNKPNIVQYQYPQDSRFHELLLKQQRQQLSILSELNKISKSLKSELFDEAAELTLDEYEFEDANNEEEEEEDSVDNNNVSWFSNLESSSGASIEQNHPFTKSTIVNNNNHHHSENIEKREEMPTMSGLQNEEPSKSNCCHIYTKQDSSSHKTTTIIQVNSPRKRPAPEREQQTSSHQVARMSKIPVKIKDATTSVTSTKSGGSIQSTSPTTSKSSFRSRIPQPSVNSKQHCEANRYNTYTKNKTTKTTNQAVVNSATFDKPAPLKGAKLECSNEVTIVLSNPASEANTKQQQQPKSNMVDIVLVPVGKLDEEVKTADSSVVVENKCKETSSRVKKREDEGYSTMSSELMHQIRVNPANSSNGSRPAGQLRKGRSKKRYCFPTLKSFSYYYNNRYYHQYHQEEAAAIAATTDSQRSENRSGDEFDYLDERVCCKYLSDTDIAALINQLSSYDKDLSYNVFHLDTLYSNVDYILFNSYASDTELVYNSNRRNLRNQHFLNSNYKLYINDYFNQPYEEEEDEDEDDEDEVDEEEEDNSDGILVRDEELERENMSDCNMIELSVDGEEVDEVDEEADGLVYDDDYNMLMMIKTSKSCENPRVRETSKSMDDFKLSEYKQYLLSDDQTPPPIPPPIFASHTSLYLNTTSGTTAASSTSSSSSSNSCDCSSSSSNSTDSLSSSSSSSTSNRHDVLSSPQLSSLSSSLSSPASTRNNRRRHRDTKVKARSSRNKNSRRRHRHHCHRHRHRRHRKHEYFTDSIENKHNTNNSGGNFFEKCAGDDDICDAFEETNDFFIDKFELEDFVAKLNMQCKMDKTIAANEKTSKQLKELNMLAAKAMEAASGGQMSENRNGVLEDDSDDLDDIIGPMLQISRGKPPPVPPQSKPVKNSHSLIRRHTITSMPISAAGLETATATAAAASSKPFCESSPRSSVANTPVKNMDSRAYVGSFNRSNYENHQHQAIPSSVNSTPCRRSSFNTTSNRIHGSHSKLISTSPLTTESPEIAQLPNSPMHQPRPMSNNFNTDFYRLCSDTLYYYGSDANLNPIPSPTHHQYMAPMLLSPQSNHPTNNLELIKEANSSLLSQQETDFPTIDRPESCSNTLTAHVNSLFDQWLLNSGARK